MYILDTDTLSLLFMNHPEVVAQLRTLPGSEVGTTIFTRAEMLRGRLEFLIKAADGAQVRRALEFLERTETFLAKITIRPFDERAAAVFDQLRMK